MLEHPHLWHCDDVLQLLRSNCSSIWSIFPGRKMPSGTVIIIEAEGDLPPQRGLIYDEHLIPAFGANRSNAAIDERDRQ